MDWDKRYDVPPTVYITSEFAQKMRAENVAWGDVLMAHLRWMGFAHDDELIRYFQQDKHVVHLAALDSTGATEPLCTLHDVKDEILSIYIDPRNWKWSCNDWPHFNMEMKVSYPWHARGEIRAFPWVADWGNLRANRIHLGKCYQIAMNLGYDIYANPWVQDTFSMWDDCLKAEADGKPMHQFREVQQYALALTDVGISYEQVMGSPPSEKMVEAMEESTPKLSGYVGGKESFVPYSMSRATPCDLYIYDRLCKLDRYMVDAIEHADDAAAQSLSELWGKVSPTLKERYSHITQMLEDRAVMRVPENPFAQIAPDQARSDGTVHPQHEKGVE